jgi:hypothetical protein
MSGLEEFVRRAELRLGRPEQARFRQPFGHSYSFRTFVHDMFQTRIVIANGFAQRDLNFFACDLRITVAKSM